MIARWKSQIFEERSNPDFGWCDTQFTYIEFTVNSFVMLFHQSLICVVATGPRLGEQHNPDKFHLLREIHHDNPAGI